MVMKKSLSVIAKLYSPILYLGKDLSVLYSDKEPKNVHESNISSCRTLILAKEYYHETLKVFPFSNSKDIQEAVKMDSMEYCPFEPRLIFMRRLRSETQETRVNLWFVRPSAAAVIEKYSPWLIVPETALAAMAMDPGLYQVPGNPKTLCFFIHTDKGVISIQGNNQSRDMEYFRKALGQTVQNLSFKSLPGFLPSLPGLLYSLSLSLLKPFFRFQAPREAVNDKFVRTGLISMAFIILLFLTAWMVLPVAALNNLKAENRILDQTLGGLLDKQAELDRMREKYTQMYQSMENYTPKLPLFNTLNRLLPGNALITRLKVSGNQVEISGSSERSSELLSSINKAPGFHGAGFTTPLRKDTKTGRDVFTINFLYDGKPSK